MFLLNLNTYTRDLTARDERERRACLFMCPSVLWLLWRTTIARTLCGGGYWGIPFLFAPRLQVIDNCFSLECSL